MTSQRLRSIVFDCDHPASLARFWAGMLGYTVRSYDQAEIERLRQQGYTVETDPSVVIDPADDGPTVWFNRVPEAKTVKNRVHLDVNLADGAEVDALIARGARVVRGPVEDERWYIMTDPEGNEFCAFPPAGQ